MCNAKNHPQDCNCGFGGYGGPKFISSALLGNLFNSHPIDVPSLGFRVLIQHTPNARCPVCREPVFYYQNQFGSKVFFDELGPPWPKHACTSNGIFRPPLKNVDPTQKKSTSAEQGWFPAILVEAGKISKDIYEFVCQISESEKLVLFVSEKDVEIKADIQLFSEESLCYLKRGAEGCYQMSLFSDDMKIMDSKAYLDKKRLN